MIPVVDFQFLPDMGRMNGQWCSIARTRSSPATITEENWACIASLIETCKLTGVDPHAYFTDVLTKLVDLWPAARIDELMPWAWAAEHSSRKLAPDVTSGQKIKPSAPWARRPLTLERGAYLYIRQSSMRQVIVIDSDQGESSASATWREGFQRLVSDVGMRHAGIVMSLEVSRLARNNADWQRLLEICALADTPDPR